MFRLQCQWHPTTTNHIDNLGLTATAVAEEQDGELDGVQKNTLHLTHYKTCPSNTTEESLRRLRTGRHGHVLSGHAAKEGTLARAACTISRELLFVLFAPYPSEGLCQWTPTVCTRM